MSNIYNVEKVNENNLSDWDELIKSANQPTFFTRKEYLSWVGYLSDNYIVYKKEIPYVGLCIPISKKTGHPSCTVPFAPYQGLIYSKLEEQYSCYHKNLEATELLLNHLYDSSVYDYVAFSNGFLVEDIRSVQWHHYHQPNLGKYNINIRYTAVKDCFEDNIVTTLSKGRRLDYRYSKERYNLLAIKSKDIRPFIELYIKTFLRQGIQLDENIITMVESIVDGLIKTGEGELWYASNPEGEIYDATFIVYDKGFAYYLFGANDPVHRKKGGGTLLLVEQMKLMKNRGIKMFDFVGVNSPYRGDFKLSFGAKIIPYYNCDVSYK